MYYREIIKKIIRKLENRVDDRTKESEQSKLVREAYNSRDLPQSVLFFTSHKCASSFMMRLFSNLSGNSKYKVTNYYSVLWNLGDQVDIFHYKPELLFEDCYDILFKKRGYIYIPLRRPFDFPGRTQFKHIFFLRDPRDVLVSSFYSSAFTHGRPKNVKDLTNYDKHRNDIRKLGINRYALKASNDWLIPLFNSYKILKENSENNIYLTYNQFINDRISFVRAILNFANIDLPISEIELITDSMSIEKNRDGKHVRSGKSNQYLTELDRDTTEILNEKFDEMLEYWGFE